MTIETRFDVGDVVRLTGYGHKILKYQYQAVPPPEGSTAVITEIIKGEWTNGEYVLKFFAYPDMVWGAYYGEIEHVA